ncbi:MAG: phosphoribosylformylglycinamidine cyclo-ligase [Actinobacteria bacterium RBG_16_64_13]|nr:MAG: phosphoribosylformylglycinamidine cyclo-ligase [Actinobacteria bacterium RBG_16_64_13]
MSKPADDLTYRAAGVDVAAGDEAVRLIKKDVESTYIPGVMGSLGGFAGLFELPKDLKDPILVTGTDGVGTKVLLAQETGKLDTVGIDLVAMSVNDVLTIGARPILFLDYVAVGRLVPEEMAQLVAGVAEGCRQAGCALVGGEMAEMPGLYDPGEFDLAGFCVGLAERSRLIDGSGIEEGDVVLGLASNGFHSNGFSLVRKVLRANGLGLDDRFPHFYETIGETLLKPTRIYVRSVLGALEQGVPIRGMAHITGGGMAGNLGRVIPEGLSARLNLSNWKVPPEFHAVQILGDVPDDEMLSTFNMGVAYVLIVPATFEGVAARLLTEAGEEVLHLGEIARGSERVTLSGLL